MGCALVNNNLPKHLIKILKQIEVGNDNKLKRCACKLKYLEQRSDSDFGYYATALPWCMPTLEEINEAINEANAFWEGTLSHSIVDLHDIDLKDLSETFYAKKFEFKGGISTLLGCVVGNPNQQPSIISINNSFDDLLDGIDIKKSVCDERFDNPENSELYVRSFVRGQTIPLWLQLSGYSIGSAMGVNSNIVQYCVICPGCPLLAQEGIVTIDECDPANCMGYHYMLGMKIFSNIYKYDEGSDCEKGRFKYKQFGVKIVNNTDNITFNPYITKVRNTLKGYGFHFNGNYGPIDVSQNLDKPIIVEVTTNN